MAKVVCACRKAAAQQNLEAMLPVGNWLAGIFVCILVYAGLFSQGLQHCGRHLPACVGASTL
jgi:hypothetical protein